MDAFEREMENLSGCNEDGFVDVELEPEEKATLTACEWIRAGAKILGFPGGEIR